ncbi:pyridoxamine 5'-phosphate oxidase family protein [Microbacterium memoriense]|uniref:Pyridoxamine 5'-phosphate oxidase family protein n=1 Tax=Microbacterium memoriense TaxID=2978350 RepID=A0ABT2P9H3_9MICO|nr:pyridoxamine 5'-phosphate oxidase family protein [Microbacterium memoriense]MCT9001248.1 pyridoxamine 5'-phosphate oxidase family protein [Microbacterium memoriense]
MADRPQGGMTMHGELSADEWADLPDDPSRLLSVWLPANDDPARPLMTLATLDENGAPDARSLLLSEWDAEGFYWHTDARSRKVAQVTRSALVALCIPLLGTPTPDSRHQLVVQGRAEPASADEQRRAYAARPPYLQQLAWQNTPEFAALPQPERVAAWADFASAQEASFVPPPSWVGYLVRPDRLTFWFGSDDTASRRVEYTRRADGWERRFLAG